MAEMFKLRCALIGHEKDVRGVCASHFPQGGVVSGSRDVTARVWAPNEQDPSFMEGHTMSGHSNFVSCVCVMPPDDKYPHGLIMTGSHDHNIHAYTLESPQPLFKLTGHTNTVCSLAAGKFGSLVSASWDKTAKVWLNEKNVFTLSGHEAAVWAVAIMPEGGFMLTGSADKTIKLWRAGKCEKTYTGHSDCVRGLAVLSKVEFLSCSNDTTIKRWLTTGECTHTYQGHTSFVYSLAVLPNGEDFISSGEDRSLRVWKDGQCAQTIAHPTESVWSVCALQNGDIVSGASDGVVRVFTTAPERWADDDLQKAYEEELAASSIPAQIGDIQTDQLPGPNVLLNPGKRDGQTVMVRDGNKIEAHQWSAVEGRWIKIGDVTGGQSGEQPGQQGKSSYMGKEYDYVFNVEIDEGQAPYKLPFNAGDDPWMAAHKFLQDNDLSPLYLDQVAKFILDNTKGVTIGPLQTDYQDPFTGSGAYVPDFGGNDPKFASPQKKENQFFPKTSYVGFDQANIQGALGKLREFNGKVPEGDRINDNVIDSFEHFANGESPSAFQFENLWKALQWSIDQRFPALDILRLSIKSASVNQHFCNMKDGQGFLDYLLSGLNPASPIPVQMLSLRVLCNAFRQAEGESLLLSQRDKTLSTITSLGASTNKNVQVALATMLLNYSVALIKKRDNEAEAQCLSVIAQICEGQSDPEAMFRLLVSVGTLVAGDANAKELAKSLNLVKYVSSCRKVSDPKKVSDCAKALMDELLS